LGSKKHYQYQYQYLLVKVRAIPVPIQKSIANTLLPILFYSILTTLHTGSNVCGTFLAAVFD